MAFETPDDRRGRGDDTTAEQTCDRLFCLTLGWEYCPRSLSLEGGGESVLRLPVCAIVVQGPGGWLLLETGIGPALRDPARGGLIYRDGLPELPGDGDPLVDELAACGLVTADIAGVAVSHLHVDHSGGLRHFADGRPVWVQRRELDFAFTEAAHEQAYVRSDYDDPCLAWTVLDGDATLAPGVDAVFTPGHTPGHMSYRVRMRDSGTWLFAVDAIDLQEGIDTATPIGSSADPADAPLRRRSHDRLVTLAAREAARLVPGHCPVTWPGRPGSPREAA